MTRAIPGLRWGTALLLLVWALGAMAKEVPAEELRLAVISGSAPPQIASDRRSLRDVFLKRVTIDRTGLRLVPLNLPPASVLRRAFSESLLGRAPQRLERYWNERYFQGVSPPYVVRSQEAMLRFVAATPGAVGYVLACRVDGRVRVLARLPVPPEYADRLAGGCGAAKADGH